MNSATPYRLNSATPYRVESVDKALRLLRLFSERSSLTVTEASRQLGVAPSTAHRLLSMLRQHGFVNQNPGSRAYVSGRTLVSIGLFALQELAVRSVARPEIEELSREVGETVHLIILQGSRTLIVDAVESPQVVRVGSRIGGSSPPSCSSAGKVLLSEMTDREVASLLGHEQLPQLTPRSIQTMPDLLAHLEQVRRQGYATNIDEHELGVTGIAVGIPTPQGMTPAAIAVNAPSNRMSGERLPMVVAAAREAAAKIGFKLSEAEIPS